mmetsp:Transcript_12588/g.18625  ORF Transcript_12588/g.18625 Transcript_12588/m.18625 type:complete len:236 (-) Transcript_12588:251-958(-)
MSRYIPMHINLNGCIWVLCHNCFSYGKGLIGEAGCMEWSHAVVIGRFEGSATMRYNGLYNVRGRRSIEASQMKRRVPFPILFRKGGRVLNGKRTNNIYAGSAFGRASKVKRSGPALFGFRLGVGWTVAEEEYNIWRGCSVLAGDVEGGVAGACSFTEGHREEVVEFVDYILRCAEGEGGKEGVHFFCLCFIVVGLIIIGLQNAKGGFMSNNGFRFLVRKRSAQVSIRRGSEWRTT